MVRARFARYLTQELAEQAARAHGGHTAKKQFSRDVEEQGVKLAEACGSRIRKKSLSLDFRRRCSPRPDQLEQTEQDLWRPAFSCFAICRRRHSQGMARCPQPGRRLLCEASHRRVRQERERADCVLSAIGMSMVACRTASSHLAGPLHVI